ncbi:MAG TPA: hypothetical protein VFY29_04950 [Terriglobia bacterium]|nr:hypothetical protein [Terriglobia bacterium]
MKLGMVVAVALLCGITTAFAADPVVVLRFQAKVDGRAVSTVEFYNCEIDPNRKLADCPQYVLVDGRRINAPERILARLDNIRRSFSYDSQSGGIRPPAAAGPMCLLGGPAEGAVLEARYLTYDQSYRIAANEMKPVFGVAYNCLFKELYAPVQANAREDARAALEILGTLRDFPPSSSGR